MQEKKFTTNHLKLLLLLIALAAILFFLLFPKKTNYVTPEKNTTSIQVTEVGFEKIVKNLKNNFSIRIPKDWTINYQGPSEGSEEDTEIFLSDDRFDSPLDMDGNFFILIESKIKPKNLDEWLRDREKKYDPGVIIKKEEIKFKDKKAIKQTLDFSKSEYPIEGGTFAIEYFILTDVRIIEFGIYPNSKEDYEKRRNEIEKALQSLEI